MGESEWVLLQTKKPMPPHPGFFPIAVVFVKDLNSIVEGSAIPDFIAVYRDDVCGVYAKKDDVENSEDRITDAVRKDPALVSRIRRTFTRKSQELLRFCEALPSEPEALSNRDLFSWYEEYLERYRQTYLYSEPIAWLTKDTLPEYLTRYIKERDIQHEGMNAEEILGALIAEERLSFAAQEELDFLRVFERARYRGEARESVRGVFRDSLEEDYIIRPLVEEHTRKWGWIPYDYGAFVWDEDHFYDELAKLLMKPLGAVHNRMDDLLSWPRTVRRRRNAICRANGIDGDHKRLFEALQHCSFLLYFKKEIFTKAHLHVQPLLSEVFRRCGLEYEAGCYLLPNEVRDALLVGKMPDPDMIRGRRTLSVFQTTHPDRHDFLSEEKRDRLLEEIARDGKNEKELRREISGISAMPGQIRGRVRILLDSRDLDSLAEGDVLVTSMTSPDYIAGMRRAAAIVTDEGGITSHAAIVARELKKPCVIGTKVATQVFRDGDLVLVNADRGVVQVLEREAEQDL